MAIVRFSHLARTDLLAIGSYTLGTWGEQQTTRYLGELGSCCQTLADNPGLGRDCSDISRGLQRFEKGSHVVFYRRETGGILVTRILHQRMLPTRDHLD